jgi:hypothetical protein
MFRLPVLILLAFAMFRPAAAQQSANPTRATLDRAMKAYDNFNVEGAMAALDSVMLGRANLTTAELASAHKLMGAGNAVLTRTGPAVDHFVEAMKLDPTTTMDPAKFAKAELSPFYMARQRWLREMGRDSARVMMQALQLAELRLGTPVPDVVFYVDGLSLGPITSMQFWYVPAGRPTALSLRSPKCTTPWDTVVNLPVGQQVTVGRRITSGCT